MSGMDQFLAEYYGTGNTPAVQATDNDTKLAQAAEVELFGKLAAANGIDLNTLTDAQIEKLYADTFSKEAEFPPAKKDGDDDDDKKKEKAEKEHEEKKAGAEKVAEADFLGRVMAHAYVQELNKIAEAGGEGETKEAKGLPPWLSKMKDGAGEGLSRGKELLSGSKAKSLGHSAETAKGIAGRAKDSGSKKLHEKATEVAGKRSVEHKTEAKKVLKARVGAGAAAGVAAGGGAALASRKKEASAMDQLAAVEAVIKAAEAGWDSEQAADLVQGILEAGPSEEGSKVASVATVEEAIDIRASELLEQAGYPVTWA